MMAKFERSETGTDAKIILGWGARLLIGLFTAGVIAMVTATVVHGQQIAGLANGLDEVKDVKDELKSVVQMTKAERQRETDKREAADKAEALQRHAADLQIQQQLSKQARVVMQLSERASELLARMDRVEAETATARQERRGLEAAIRELMRLADLPQHNSEGMD